jgi:hypothetical protein
MKINVIVHHAEEGGFGVKVPALQADRPGLKL